MKERLFFLAVLAVLSICLPAQGQPWSGSGIEGDPYLIEDANDMQAIGADPNYWNAHFKLVNDINLAGFTGTEFNIAGNYDTRFTGVFDGNGHTISNFSYTTTESNYIGLFGYVDDPNSEIKDLFLMTPHLNVPGGCDIGALVGMFRNGIITNCVVESGNVSGRCRVGGLIGQNRDAVISGCHSLCEVSGDGYIGGLSGTTCDSIMSNCYSDCDVSGRYYIGGLAGFHENADLYTLSVISNCYSTSRVSGYEAFIGGLVGRIYKAFMSHCYATGTVNGNGGSAGGLVGAAWIGTMLYSYWDIQTSGLADGLGDDQGANTIQIYGKTTAQMRQKATFVNWDFVEIWGIGENQTYPYLRVYPAGDLNHDGRVDMLDFAIFANHWLAGVE